MAKHEFPERDTSRVEVCGTISVEPEIRVFDSGSRMIRYLVVVRSEAPRRRVDVVPVTYRDPTDEELRDCGDKGRRIWITGRVERRYWESPDGRRSRIQVMAETVKLEPVDQSEAAGHPA